MQRPRSVRLLTKLSLLTIGLLMTSVSVALLLLHQERSYHHRQLPA